MNFASELLFDCPGAKGEVIYPTESYIDPAKSKELLKEYALYPTQTHSTNVAIAKNNIDSFPDTDALITFLPGMSIGILTADCVPILLYSPDIKAVAAIHAGWKGTLGGIVDNAVEILLKHNAKPEKMIAFFGPSISVSNYEVDNTLALKFKENGFLNCITYPNGIESKPHIDLQKVNIERLLKKGLRKENIKRNNNCTLSSKDNNGKPKYQSYRRDGDKSLRNLTMITLK